MHETETSRRPWASGHACWCITPSGMVCASVGLPVIRKGAVTSKTFAGVARVGFFSRPNRVIRTVREEDMFRNERAARMELATRLREYAANLMAGYPDDLLHPAGETADATD
jgi:hypothetical protein